MIPKEAFSAIIAELERKPLVENRYRNKSGVGRSQAFGVVNKRCMPPDYSRQNWLRPYLYKCLCDFAETYVDISWNAITLNQNYRAEKHRDKGNQGISYLVSFGDFTGGQLRIHEGELEGLHDIDRKPIRADFSKIYHSVEEFSGNRYSLVFYTLKTKKPLDLPPGSVEKEGDEWVFKRGGVICKGLPHPLRKEGLTIKKELTRVDFK